MRGSGRSGALIAAALAALLLASIPAVPASASIGAVRDLRSTSSYGGIDVSWTQPDGNAPETQLYTTVELR
jgi:hypothetical protein